MRLIWHNCRTFNTLGSDIVKLADAFQKDFEARCAAAAYAAATSLLLAEGRLPMYALSQTFGHGVPWASMHRCMPMVHLCTTSYGFCRWQREGLPLTPDGSFPASPRGLAALPGANGGQAAPGSSSRQADQPASAHAQPAVGQGASGTGAAPPAQNGRGQQRGFRSIKVVLPSCRGRRDSQLASPIAAACTAEPAGTALVPAARPASKPSSHPSTEPGLPDSELARAVRVVRAVLKLKVALNFAMPVREEWAPGYHSVITHPMDLGTIAARLAAGQYADAGELANLQRSRM